MEIIPVFTSQTPEMLASNEFSSMVSQHLIMSEIPDYEDRIFYLSGPRSMVEAFSDLLSQIGVPRSHIKKDFFPGFV
jgi:ferredoxin-NADP reductase